MKWMNFAGGSGGLALATCALLVLGPVGSAQAGGSTVDDAAFNEMIGTMAGEDTGSQWFNAYVEHLNQDIAYKDSSEAYGAAGPSGPLTGFDGYLAGFVAPDTGSRWFDLYVDHVNRDLRTRPESEF